MTVLAGDRSRTGQGRAESLARSGIALSRAASRFEREGLMLADALHRYAAAPGRDTLQTIDLRLALLYSRIEVLRAGREADALIGTASGREQVARAGDRLAAVEVMINGLGRDSTVADALAALGLMLTTAGQISGLADRLGSDMLDRQMAIRRAVEAELMLFGLVAAVCALLAMAAVVADMIRSDRALRQTVAAQDAEGQQNQQL